MFGGTVLRLAGAVPAPVRRWIYGMPAVARLGSRVLRACSPDDKPVIVTIKQGPLAGWKLAVDRDTPKYYWLRGHDEPAVVDLMRSLLKEGDVAVDVGAHIGIETLMMSRWVGSSGVVYSLEPDPHAFARLKRNCRLNEVANVELLPVAAAAKRGVVQFVGGGNVTSHVQGKGVAAAAEGDVTEVAARTLDDLLHHRAERVAMVKIDVEDFEADVLRGASQVMRSLRPVLVIEIHSPHSLCECIALLDAAGYTFTPMGISAERMHAIMEGDTRAATELNDFERFHLVCRPATQAGITGGERRP